MAKIRTATTKRLTRENAYEYEFEEAVKQAFFGLVDWLVEDYGFSQRDAGLQMGANPDVRINVYRMVVLGRVNYTVGVSIPKKYLR